MSLRTLIPARASVAVATLALILAMPASAADLHLVTPPAGVSIGQTVCTEDYLLDTELYATICRTTYSNPTPNGDKAHVHVSGSVKNKSTQQRPYFLIKMEIILGDQVKLRCEFKAHIKPGQTANCADGMRVDPTQIPNMRVHWDFLSDEI